MKIEAKFTAKNNKLYRISNDSEISLDSPFYIEAKPETFSAGISAIVSEPASLEKPKIIFLTLSWKSVETSPEAYNEELLASLRDFLKTLEETEIYAVIAPATESSLKAEETESFTAAMKHSARRIKDCQNVIGFSIPEDLISISKSNGNTDLLKENSPINTYMAELSQKHEHYIYFAKNQNSDCIDNSDIILY